MILSKTLELPDYEKLGQHVKCVDNLLSIPSRMEHTHRRWEYAMTYKALDEEGVKTVLDVGGSGSLLTPVLIQAGMDVLQVDPADNEWLLSKQGLILGKELAYDRVHFELWEKDDMFDAVVCISVLEHVPDDIAMFRKLLKHALKTVVITVDFSPTGKAVLAGHIRTYNQEMMENFISIAKEQGFVTAGGEYDYSKPGNHVNGYNFASLVLVKTD